MCFILFYVQNLVFTLYLCYCIKNGRSRIHININPILTMGHVPPADLESMPLGYSHFLEGSKACVNFCLSVALQLFLCFTDGSVLFF